MTSLGRHLSRALGSVKAFLRQWWVVESPKRLGLPFRNGDQQWVVVKAYLRAKLVINPITKVYLPTPPPQHNVPVKIQNPWVV